MNPIYGTCTALSSHLNFESTLADFFSTYLFELSAVGNQKKPKKWRKVL